MSDSTNRVERIRGLLEEWTGEPTEWPFLEEGERISRKEANKFMLGAIVDYQVEARLAWENARRFAEDVLGDPTDLWGTIMERWTEAEWNRSSTWKECRLHHRFPAAHRRVRAIGVDICEKYGGDVRRIWDGESPREVLCRLDGLGRRGVGEQIARMIVGALIDTGRIQGKGEFKADTHVRTVLGRLFDGDKATEKRAFEIGEMLSPSDTWKLDGPLFWHGMRICRANAPRCGGCFLQEDCVYSGTHG